MVFLCSGIVTLPSIVSRFPSSLCPHVAQIEPQFSTNQSHARLAQSVERETLTSTRSQGCGFDPRIGLFL
ncbi:unnamed protein product [Fusarium venenatum]|uniref:Uncharacterized protein n=1 Tax=Fusarium venenatum TaxID=56646 RepID=A0A2L2SWY7_9HYPO|nr:uncharacterized protein FVRRES_06770 [Fusarium venenatum]CEI62334.1 unnamed protein product [Fusarium venenatum]